MDFVRRLKESKLCHILLAVTFVTSALIINAFQAILYYGLRPCNRYLFRKINYYANYSLFCQIVFISQYWANTKVTLHVKKSDFNKYFGKEHGFLIMNHTYEIDWMVGWILCDNVGLLGNAKSYAKKSLQYIPTMGWAWKFSECVFLERNWEKDKDTIRKQITELINYPDPMWLLLTAEGTRFTETKYKLSKSFAEENGLPVLKHHLTPRTKGFTYSLPYFRENIKALYNVILVFRRDGVKPTLTNLLLGKVLEADMYVERIPISEVPENEAEAAKWLHELYRQKDQMLDKFLESGAWFEKRMAKETCAFVLPRRIYPLLNTCAWALVTLPFIIYYTSRLFMSGSILYFVIGSVLIASCKHHLKQIVQVLILFPSSFEASSDKPRSVKVLHTVPDDRNERTSAEHRFLFTVLCALSRIFLESPVRYLAPDFSESSPKQPITKWPSFILADESLSL